MKKTLFTIAFALVLNLAFAQTKEKELANAEKFSAKSGSLIQKEFIDAGELGAVKFKIVKYTDLIENKSITSLKIEKEFVGKYSSSSKTAILDADEIDGLIKSIEMMQTKVFPSTVTNYTEYNYKSRGGFEAGCFWSKEKWSTYLKLEKHDNDSYYWISQNEFITMLELLKSAKTKMQ